MTSHAEAPDGDVTGTAAANVAGGHHRLNRDETTTTTKKSIAQPSRAPPKEEHLYTVRDRRSSTASTLPTRRPKRTQPMNQHVHVRRVQGAWWDGPPTQLGNHARSSCVISLLLLFMWRAVTQGAIRGDFHPTRRGGGKSLSIDRGSTTPPRRSPRGSESATNHHDLLSFIAHHIVVVVVVVLCMHEGHEPRVRGAQRDRSSRTQQRHRRRGVATGR